MMSKFEMALLTVTVVGTLVAWPALPGGFVRAPNPRHDRQGHAALARMHSADVRPSPDGARAYVPHPGAPPPEKNMGASRRDPDQQDQGECPPTAQPTR